MKLFSQAFPSSLSAAAVTPRSAEAPRSAAASTSRSTAARSTHPGVPTVPTQVGLETVPTQAGVGRTPPLSQSRPAAHISLSSSILSSSST